MRQNRERSKKATKSIARNFSRFFNSFRSSSIGPGWIGTEPFTQTDPCPFGEERELAFSESSRLLKGLTRRSTLTDCPLGAFKVEVTTCTGKGECADACFVNVFERNPFGQCTVVNEELCFGCATCLAQCSDGGVSVVPNDLGGFASPEELLK
jgi:NAD-dependent dihydropyrimidine dehydrogenase PreA subunit